MPDSQKPLTKKIIWQSWAFLLLVKLLFAYGYCQLILSQRPERKIGMISYASGDYKSYIGAMENLIQHKKYFFINQLGDTSWAGRPPHFTLPYWLARQVTGREQAADFLTVVNVTLDCFAILCMALLASALIGPPRRSFYIAMGLGLISTYVSNWSFITLPDSAGAALLMIGTFFYWRAYQSGERRSMNVFWASFFFSWAICLRPFLILPVVASALIFLVRKKPGFKATIKLAVISAIPLLLFISPWIIRNYQVTGKFIPFQQDIYAGYGYRPTELATRRLMTTLGEDGGTFWDPYAMASYFTPEKYETSKFRYPGYLMKDTTLLNRIESLRAAYLSSFGKRSPREENEMVVQTETLRKDYIKSYRLRYYFSNPFKRFVSFWGHSGSYYISVGPNESRILLLDKYLQSALYYFALLFGTIGLLWLSRRSDLGWILLIPLVVLTLMFPVVMGFSEPRYALSFYYPCLVGGIFFVDFVLKKFFSRSGTGLVSEIAT